MAHETTEDIVELSVSDGIAFVEQASPLTRLHYFDGKFLRADAFATEQDYHRARVRLANIAGGWGVVNGLEISLRGAQLAVGAGLAVTPAGNFVLATSGMRADLARLLELNQREDAPPGRADFGDCLQPAKAGVKESAPQAIYEITVGPVEGLCGNEAVYGKLCESACATDSRHPYWREGVVLRLRPRALVLPGSSAVPVTGVHLRNRVASAYFALEPGLAKSQVSAAGLAGDVWCGGAQLYGRDEVVIGLLVREGGSTRVIDAWSGRRERMDAQARGYWQGRMAMRPWNVFLAQILQFQCQLSGALEPGGGQFTPIDDCDRIRALLDKTRRELEALSSRWSQSGKKLLLKTGDLSRKQIEQVSSHVDGTYAEIGQLTQDLAIVEAGVGALPVQRMLIAAGFLDLPPAGYLPVAPAKVALEVQLQRMFGEGVQLHLHAVAEDEIAHLLEEAQHMRRISLTRGIDDPKSPERVEVFVPEGRVVDTQAPASGEWWQVVVQPELADASQGDKLPVKPPPALAPVPAPGPVPTPVAPQAAGAAATKTAAKVAAKSVAKSAAKSKAPVSKATAPGTPLPAGQIKADFDLGELLSGKTRLRVPGLARTHVLDDGHPALSLVLALEADDPPKIGLIVRKGEDKDGSNSNSDGDGDGGSNGGGNDGADPRLAVWAAGDIADDLFALPVGGDTAARGELRAAFAGLSAQAGGSATLTVLARESSPRGGVRLRLQVDLMAHIKLTLLRTGISRDDAVNGSERFTLELDGDGRSGRLIADEDPMDITDGAGILRWGDSPREAVLELIFTLARRIVAKGLEMVKEAGAATVEFNDMPPGLIGRINQPPDTAGRQILIRLARAYGLPGMPAPASATGAAAMNALAFIADASDDAGFLARARRRLFPTLDTPAVKTVRASLDWVMFRRARTHLCAPPCASPVDTRVEAVQVWHLQVDSDKALELLKKALAQGDAKTLSSFKFQRVGLLRYRDESTRPEESASTVLAMWKAVRPAERVVLGRAWEEAPATGQGWQNHFRLREMLGLIKPLTKPPVRGDGSLAAMKPPGPPLQDRALDGGMLVVTQAEAEAKLSKHRLLVTTFDEYGAVLANLKRDPERGWRQIEAMLAQGGLRMLDLTFDGGVMDAGDRKKVQELDAEMRKNNPESWFVRSVRIDATVVDAATDAGKQHAAVAELLGPAGARGDDGALQAPVADVGGGAQVLSFAYYQNQG